MRLSLEDIRKACGKWDEKEGCEEDYPEECLNYADCERDAVGQAAGGEWDGS